MEKLKSPTEVLREDHKAVLGKLNDLEKAISKLDAQAIVMLKELAKFLQGEVVVHFAKEEEALFPEIEKFIPREGGPTGMMLIEHEDLNNAKAKMIEGIEGLSKNSADEKFTTLVRENGRHYIDVLRQHIDKEDNILFMMAEMHLDDEQAQTITKLFAEIDERHRTKD